VVPLVEQEAPTVFAYAEISTGSFRNQWFDQHQYLVNHFPDRAISTAAVSKYGETALSTAPFHTGNANGVITFQAARVEEQYLRRSRKRLVFRVELETVTIFILHLPIVSSDRRAQLLELSELVRHTTGNIVVCGDLNIFAGIGELAEFQTATGLVVAGNGEPTYPAVAPRLPLDVFLYRFANNRVTPNFRVLSSPVSDHLPIVLEWSELG
jgi:endonuclease/exonuclease/phosphatase family metal-dependent hydrolase